MSDIARLGYVIDSTGVVRATVDLDKMGNAAERAGNEAQEAGKKSKAAGELFAQTGKAVAAFGAAAVVSNLQIARLGDQIDKGAQRANLAAREYQILSFVAEQTGTSMDTLGGALLRAQRRLANAATGAGPAVRAVEALGINIQELNRLDGPERLAEIVDRLNDIEDPSYRAQLAFEVLGDEYKQLMPLIAAGSDEIRRLSAEMEASGAIMSDELVAKSVQLNDRMNLLGKQFLAFRVQLASEFIPIASETTKALGDIITGAEDTGQAMSTAEQAGRALGVGLNVASQAGVYLRFGFQATGKVVGTLVGLMVELTNVMTGPLRLAFASFTETMALIQQGDLIGAARRATVGNIEAIISEAEGIQARVTAGIEGFASDVATDYDDMNAAISRLDQALADAAEKQAELNEEQKEGARTGSQALGSQAAEAQQVADLYAQLVEAYRPAQAAQNAYVEGVRLITQARLQENITAEEHAEMLQLLKERYEDATEATDETASATERAGITFAEIESQLQRELVALQGGAQAWRLYQREQWVAQQVARMGTEVTDEQIRKLGDLYDALEQASGAGGRFNLGDALTDAVDSAFSEGNLRAFFDSLQEGIARAWSQGSASQRADMVNQAVGTVGNIAAAIRGPGSDMERAVNAAAQIPGVIGTIAQTVQGINEIFGGKLLGTDWEQVGAGIGVTIGRAGAEGVQRTMEERERSFFRGTRRRTTEEDLDASTQDQIDAIFEAIGQSMGNAARALGQSVPELIGGQFKQEFDADGNLVESVSTVLGRTFSEGLEEFARRLEAENVLAVVGQAFDGVNEIAERWRDDAFLLSEGATLLAQAGADIQQGRELLETLGETVTVVEGLQFAGETLIETYSRLQGATASLEEALGMLGLEASGTRTEFIAFAADIADAAGGLDRARHLWGTFFDSFFSDSESLEARQRMAQQRAGGMLSDLGLDADITGAAFREASEAALQQGLSAEAIARWLEAGEALANVLDIQAQINANERERAEALGSYADAVAAVNEEIALAELSEFQRAIAEIEIARREEVDALNEAARAAGLQAAREEDLAAVHERAAMAAGRAIAQLEQAARETAGELFGTPLSNIEAEIQRLEEASRSATRGVSDFSSSIDQAGDQLRNFGQDLLTGRFSPLNSAQRLAEARQQLEQAAQAGDAQRTQQLAQTVLGIGRERFASGQQYNDLFADVQRIVSGVNPQQDRPLTAADIGTAVSSELQALLERRDELEAEQQAREDLLLGQELAQQIADLALARGDTFAEVAALLGVDLAELASVLDMEQDALAGFLTSLQQDGADVVSGLEAARDGIVSAIERLGDRLTGSGDVNDPYRVPVGPGFVPVPGIDFGPVSPLPGDPDGPGFGPRIPPQPGPGPGPGIPTQPNSVGSDALARAIVDMRDAVTRELVKITQNTSAQASGVNELARTVRDQAASQSRTILTG